METFEEIFKTVKHRFIHLHGQAKYNRIEDVVLTSKKLAILNEESYAWRKAPTAKDIGAHLQSIGYFIFAKNNTNLMGSFIALNQWNNRVNSRLLLSTEAEVVHRAKALLRMWGSI